MKDDTRRQRIILRTMIGAVIVIIIFMSGGLE